MFLPLLTSSAEYILLLRNAATLVKDQLHPEYKSLGRLKQHVLRLLIATPRFSWPGEHKVGMTEVQNDFAFRLASLLYNSESRSFSLKNKPYGEQEVLDAPLVKNQNRDDRRAEYGIAKSITIFKDLGRHSASHPGDSIETEAASLRIEATVATTIMTTVLMVRVRSGLDLDPRVEGPLDSFETDASLRIKATVATASLRLEATTAALMVRSGIDLDPRVECPLNSTDTVSLYLEASLAMSCHIRLEAVLAMAGAPHRVQHLCLCKESCRRTQHHHRNARHKHNWNQRSLRQHKAIIIFAP